MIQRLPLLALALLAACAPRQPAPEAPREPPGQELVLPPPSREPRYAIATSDPDEVALLRQQLKLGNVTVTQGLMYFDADQGQLGRLRELGYTVTQADPEAVGYRIVRVRRRGQEEELRGQGLTVISREPGYWIVSGTLAQLRRLVAAGYRLEAIAPNEPRPRLIRIDVASQLDVQRVANFEIDIHSVLEGQGRFTIRGAALDMQIDALRAAGFTVVVVP